MSARKVFGRMDAVVNGRTLRFEMQRDGLHVWIKRRKRKWRLSFDETWQVVNGQGIFNFSGGVENPKSRKKS